jgi:hypothetical protein
LFFLFLGGEFEMGKPKESDGYDEDSPISRDQDERARHIEHMLSVVEAEFEDSGRGNEFVDNLRDQFDRTARLTDKQILALRKFYRRAAYG